MLVIVVVGGMEVWLVGGVVFDDVEVEWFYVEFDVLLVLFGVGGFMLVVVMM